MKLIMAIVALSFICKVNASPRVDLSGVEDAYERARAVFIGKVVKIEPFITELDADGSRFDKVTFKVEYSWKGAGFQEFGLPEFVVLLEVSELSKLGIEPSFPTVSFSENKTYLVFAEERPDKKNLVVGFLSRTKPLWDASEDLKELRRVSGPFPFRIRQ